MRSEIAKQHSVLELIPALLTEKTDETLNLNIPESVDVWFVGVGKAAIKTAKSVNNQIGQQFKDGLIIAPSKAYFHPKFQVFEGTHPYPDGNTVAASYELVDFIQQIPAGDTLIFSVSGGASSMFCIPPFGVEIDELQHLYSLLLKSGASIHQINTVRKHVCDVKGGKLISQLHHLNVISLIESDVPGDEVHIIGSGPTIHDPSTFLDAIKILKEFNVWDSVSLSIQEHLICGLEGYIPENPKPKISEHPSHRVELLTGHNALNFKIEKLLKEHGYHVWLNEVAYSGDVLQVSKQICTKSISILSDNDAIQKPAALIYNGECSINVKSDGKGGRNQQLALMVALSIEGQHPISMLSMDTDGIDGPTDAAGAIIDSFTTLDARKLKIEPEAFLMSNNSYEFHQKIGTHLKTGPTGVNLMDLQVVLID